MDDIKIMVHSKIMAYFVSQQPSSLCMSSKTTAKKIDGCFAKNNWLENIKAGNS
jgi:hypothetical protein